MARVINMLNGKGRELVMINKDHSYIIKSIVEIAIEDVDMYIYTNDGEKVVIRPTTTVAQDGWSRRREYVEYTERMYAILFSKKLYTFNGNVYTSVDGILYRNRGMADGHKEVAFV